MKYIRFILIAVVVVFLAYFFFVVNRDIGEDKTWNTGEQEQTKQSGFETKTNEQGQVTVKVTPQISDSAGQLRFDVVFDTHSVELDQDLMQIAVLIDDQGKEHTPSVWEGTGPGGHHREGVLVFEEISPVLVYVELKIKDVGGVPERSFKWNIE